ncbi:MAG: hypothetical protein ACE5F8_03335, partial [Woeseiaceae bacterium]
MGITTIGISLVVVLFVAYNTFKILKEYERGVVFLLGRFHRVKGPGIIVLMGGVISAIMMA